MVHALLDGRQRVLLRKGGIGEKRFEVAAQEFLLFPTVAHSHAERVRPEHRDLLDAAAADSDDEHLLVRAAAKVVAALPVNRPDNLGRNRGSAYLDRRVGARRPARLPAQTQTGGAGGVGDSADRAGAPGAHPRVRGLHQLGAMRACPCGPRWRRRCGRRRGANRASRPGSASRRRRLTGRPGRREAPAGNVRSARHGWPASSCRAVSTASSVPRLRA